MTPTRTLLVSWLWVLLGLAGSSSSAGPAPDDSTRFVSESITLTVTDSTASVSGWYRFENLSSRARKVAVVYPFAIDALHHYPHAIRVRAVAGADTIPVEFRKLGDLAGVWLLVPLQPNAITTWHAEYEQRIVASCARYILTSTAAWGRPLRSASYHFIHPSRFRGVEVWPEPDSVAIVPGWRTLSCRRETFMPRGDMWIRWQDPTLPACPER